MTSPDYKPRISFEVTDEQKEFADTYLETYGIRKAVFGVLLDDIASLVADYGRTVIGIIISEKLKPSEVLPSMAKAKRVGEAMKGD